MKEIFNNWNKFINEQEIGSGVRSNIRTAVENVRKQLVKRYQSSQAAESFVNFSKGMGSPAFKEASDEEIKAYFNKTLAPKLVNIVNSIKTTDDRSEFPENVDSRFATGFDTSRGTVRSIYDSATNVIYFNTPSFIKSGETSLKSITAAVMEEFQHALDSNTKVGDLFPSLAGKTQADIRFAPSISLGKALLSDITKSPTSKEEEYITDPAEFYAKMQVIKSKLKEKNPNFFDEKGNISQEALMSVVDMPSMYFDEDEVDLRVFKMLKKSQPDKIRSYMNRLVKVQKTKKDTQMA